MNGTIKTQVKEKELGEILLHHKVIRQLQNRMQELFFENIYLSPEACKQSESPALRHV